MISQTEAAESLRDIERVSRRTGVAGAYRHASPHLLLWGAVWALGYTATGLTRPEQWGLVWLPLVLIGAIGGVVLGMRNRAPSPARLGGGYSPNTSAVIMAVAISVFMGCTYAVFRPTDLLPFLVFPALIVGLIYSLIGAFGMPRFLLIGAGVLVVTMAGYLFAPQWTSFWIAGAGGGGLLLGGLWLRNA